MLNGNMNNTPVRNIKARVELYNGSTLARVFNSYDVLKSINIERVGESKFFGFGFCQRLNFHLRDTRSEIEVTTANNAKVYFNETSVFPNFWITEAHRDENTGELSITAYDIIYTDKLVSDIQISTPYTIREFAEGVAAVIGASGLVIEGLDDATCFDLSFENGANFEGSETIREALNAIAEATQTIYYVNNNNALVFKRLNIDGVADYTITKDLYITLESGTNRRLCELASVTDLGDNVSYKAIYTGTPQYIRNNPFWELREDIDTLVNNAWGAVGGMTINQFKCNWRGNYLLEIGDKIALINKDNTTSLSYILNDTINYDGAFSQKTEWHYEETDETESNPTTLGEQLKQTYARVDKVNKQIDLVVSDNTANKETITALQLDNKSINSSVKSIEENTKTALEGVNNSLLVIDSKIEQTAKDLKIEFNNQSVIDSVTTSTGFKFNADGLNISKSGSEMETQITEDGMTVSRGYKEMLTANNQGVKAVNLHANTYLIIGDNSRLEDYKNTRTACFWIGG